MAILVTGGTGYIGSHIIVELMMRGYDAIAVDNLSNSSRNVIGRIASITGREIPLYIAYVQDRKKLSSIFKNNQIDAVVHCAGLKAVGESVSRPLLYYSNNIESTIALCEVMSEANVKNLIFSSSATVYSTPYHSPLKETDGTGQGIPHPYGQTKYMIEQMLGDMARADPAWNITSLRYFNPVGAHSSGLIGEDPRGIPNNLMPYLAQVAVGRREKLYIFGDDYATPDGTGVRDYIHVVDVARGHVAALEGLSPSNEMHIYNLGTGRGVSVMELLRAFEKASGKKIPYEISDRRPGDGPSYHADASKAAKDIRWRTQKTIDDCCLDTWRWQSQNPNGYM